MCHSNDESCKTAHPCVSVSTGIQRRSLSQNVIISTWCEARIWCLFFFHQFCSLCLTRTHMHAHTLAPRLIIHLYTSIQYSIITVLHSLWTWPHPVVKSGGWVATYQPVHVCLLNRLCVFRHSAAMQSSARGNQLQSVTLSCCVGEESLQPLSFDEQGLGCVILE